MTIILAVVISVLVFVIAFILIPKGNRWEAVETALIRYFEAETSGTGEDFIRAHLPAKYIPELIEKFDIYGSPYEHYSYYTGRTYRFISMEVVDTDYSIAIVRENMARGFFHVDVNDIQSAIEVKVRYAYSNKDGDGEEKTTKEMYMYEVDDQWYVSYH